jgi:hypothetical protein
VADLHSAAICQKAFHFFGRMIRGIVMGGEPAAFPSKLLPQSQRNPFWQLF